jgi:NhaP-type Na+/H+ or K+/H+ antiporter
VPWVCAVTAVAIWLVVTQESPEAASQQLLWVALLVYFVGSLIGAGVRSVLEYRGGLMDESVDQTGRAEA